MERIMDFVDESSQLYRHIMKNKGLFYLFRQRNANGTFRNQSAGRVVEYDIDRGLWKYVKFTDNDNDYKKECGLFRKSILEFGASGDFDRGFLARDYHFSALVYIGGTVKGFANFETYGKIIAIEQIHSREKSQSGQKIMRQLQTYFIQIHLLAIMTIRAMHFYNVWNFQYDGVCSQCPINCKHKLQDENEISHMRWDKDVIPNCRSKELFQILKSLLNHIENKSDSNFILNCPDIEYINDSAGKAITHIVNVLIKTTYHKLSIKHKDSLHMFLTYINGKKRSIFFCFGRNYQDDKVQKISDALLGIEDAINQSSVSEKVIWTGIKRRFEDLCIHTPAAITSVCSYSLISTPAARSSVAFVTPAKKIK